MRLISTIFAAGAMLALSSFNTQAAEATASDLVSGTYSADPAHSTILFQTNHLGLSTFVARFDDYTTDLKIDVDDFSKSSLVVTVKPDSVDINLPLFAEHMSSENWFDVAKYPEVTFKSTSFEQTSPTEGKVTGDLTIRGITKPLTLAVRLVGAGLHPMKQSQVFGIEARGIVKRSEYGMTYGLPLVPDDVKLIINAEFHKQD
jgi:polyisoprenoid-binding protein YceI